MGATVTNEGKGVTTKTSDHTYITQAPTDICLDPTKKVPIPHPNYVKTDQAVEHTSGKTLFQNGNVVRVQEALEPSDPAHPDTGGGVVSGTYRKEARATSGSPNVRVEGLPPARTDDPTTQNHANTVGKVLQDVPEALLVDNPEEYFKRCSYDTSTIKCAHQAAVTMPQIDVKRGDSITIEAKRKNAKVPDAPPDCVQPPHMKWKVTRSGGTDWMGVALPPRSEEFTGDKLELDESWIPSTDPPNVGSLTQETDAAKQTMIADKNTYAAQNAAARGSSRVEGQDTRAAYQQVSEDRKRRQAAIDDAQALADFAQFLVFWRALANPVRVAIVGNACSGSVTYEVHGYPEKKYEFEIPLEGLSKTVQWINRAMAPVRTIGQLANVRVENSLLFPAGEVKITLAFEWKEGENEDIYAMTREASITLSGKIFEWKFEVSVPLTNFLAIIPFAGAVASRAVGWVIQRLGADASVGFAVEISLSAEAAMAFSWNKKRGWQWEASITLPLEVKIYGFVRVQWRDNLHIEGRIIVQADPALKLEGTSAGLVLKNNKFEVKVGLTGTIKIDVWFYSYENSGEWFPDCLKCEVPETELWNIIGN